MRLARPTRFEVTSGGVNAAFVGGASTDGAIGMLTRANAVISWRRPSSKISTSERSRSVIGTPRESIARISISIASTRERKTGFCAPCWADRMAPQRIAAAIAS